MTGLPVRERHGHVDVDQYVRLVRAGVFAPKERLELIDGEILARSPCGDPHVVCISWLTRAFAPLAVADRALLHVQLPLQMGERSMPEPSVSLLGYRAGFDWSPRPQAADALLVVEVADTSLRFDRGRKRRLYASQGVPEMWVVDVNGDVVDVATEPSPGGYGRIVQAGPGDVVAPLAFPDLTVDVGQMFEVLRKTRR